MTSFRTPSGASSPGPRRYSSVNRSSAAMSRLLGQFDGVLGAVELRQARVVLQAGRHRTVAQDRPVALVVVAEQAGRQVVAAAVPLAPLVVDLYLHFHCVVPVCVEVTVGPNAVTRRLSRSAHSASPTACRSGVIRALPIASRRQKCASASGDRAGSSSPPAWATRMRSAIQSARSPM